MTFQGITDLEQANRWLEEHFIEDYNRRFGVQSAEPGNAFAKVSAKQQYAKVAFAYEAAAANDSRIRPCGHKRGRSMTRVCISSKPAPLP